ncbi:peptidase A2 domain-containing protein [Nephila pilipes]|uniref:Peptidase A2 domain-containing protein n=1 Tax=Nephila pilipes TaxID=299642 RepID=A0A8X6T5X9_NEPPI|nr:peptidase A2 domain-containing protein [Nephila pilipes]
MNDFPNIVKAHCANRTVKHSIMHHIDTFGPPVFVKLRRLATDSLKIAKIEFQHMFDLNYMHPSNSNHASHLHLVPKKESNEWRSVGDYRTLNSQTNETGISF